MEKIKKAVYDTSGKILTYNGEVAMTVFHSQSGGGRTENSKDVWGGDVPYLVSVESHGEESAPNFYSSVKISFEQFRKTLEEKDSNFKINNLAEIAAPVISDGGNVKTIKIGNTEFEGKELRQLFNLRSSCFKIRRIN